MSGLRLVILIAMLAACAAPTGTSPPAESDAPPSIAPSADPTAALADPTASPSPTPRPATWTEMTRTGPAAREDHTWTVDAAGRTAYLFGGRAGSTVFDDLWAFDMESDTWSEVTIPGPRPPARFGHEAAWVDGIGLVVVFGQSGGSFFNDLWAFDPGAGAWQALPASGAVPVARYGSCAVVGPDGRLWISHGFTSENARFSDTAAYDFGTDAWTDETPAGDVPVIRCLHGCWWTDAGALRLYGGQTNGVTALGDLWELSAEGAPAWTAIGDDLPAERNLYARARVGAATVIFGGQGIDGAYRNDLFTLVDDADVPRPIVAEGDAPAGRAAAEMVFDADRGRLLLFGGRDDAGARADLWVLADAPTD